ncbi:MAG TPA: HAMP domain-containing methyl-accepting chemotaxis protein, partial [Ktedonobacteraceae bacterium]|nr:HAMP domain-containing methyl-accepting chemotaxis protein [Ktedonobacteraceae bacterium]
VDIRGQAVRTSFDAQNAASLEQINLQRMNALLQTRHNQIFASLSNQIKDASLSAAGALISGDIFAREADFNQALTDYQNNYALATSSNMSNIQSILMSDNPNTHISSDQQAALNKVINVDWPKYRGLQDQELKQLDAATSGNQPIDQVYSTAYQTLFNANTAFTNLKNDWQKVVDIAIEMGKTVTAVGPSQTQPIIISTVISLFCVVLVVLATGYIVNLTITQPLRQLASLTRRISRGDTSARARLAGRDEISTVASSMNSMLDNIVRLIQDTQSQRDALQTQVEKLVSEVSGVGEGDLRIQAEVTSDALGVLADSFNYMVEELGALIVRVKSVAQEVEDSTISILDHMSQLVETGDIQLNQIAQSTVEVEHMANSSRQVADRSQTLYSVAQDARRNAQGGREAVQQAVEGMGRIHQNVQTTANKVQTLGENSREINNIVEVISSIAHQTNRLALDAAIQAAMAGENGKGFGAVAADIRRLAERSKDQASSIARIVRSIREDIGAAAVSMQDTERETFAGTQLTQEAGVALESIFGAVEYQAKEIESINQAAVQQLQASSNVVQIMRSISNSTQQSNISTRSASQNTERLARLVEQLRASTEAFKLRDNQGYYNSPANVSVSFDDEQDNQLSVSGIFRTVSASALAPGMGPQQALPPARQPDVYAPYPPLPAPYNGTQYNGEYGQNSGWNDSMQQNQQQYEPWSNGQATNNGGWNR